MTGFKIWLEAMDRVKLPNAMKIFGYRDGDVIDPKAHKLKYRALSMTHHPDKGGDQEKFKDVNAAYERLQDFHGRSLPYQGDPETAKEFQGQPKHPWSWPDPDAPTANTGGFDPSGGTSRRPGGDPGSRSSNTSSGSNSGSQDYTGGSSGDENLDLNHRLTDLFSKLDKIHQLCQKWVEHSTQRETTRQIKTVLDQVLKMGLMRSYEAGCSMMKLKSAVKAVASESQYSLFLRQFLDTTRAIENFRDTAFFSPSRYRELIEKITPLYTLTRKIETEVKNNRDDTRGTSGNTNSGSSSNNSSGPGAARAWADIHAHFSEALDAFDELEQLCGKRGPKDTVAIVEQLQKLLKFDRSGSYGGAYSPDCLLMRAKNSIKSLSTPEQYRPFMMAFSTLASSMEGFQHHPPFTKANVLRIKSLFHELYSAAMKIKHDTHP